MNLCGVQLPFGICSVIFILRKNAEEISDVGIVGLQSMMLSYAMLV
jgi:hypothetical protein